jgi:hypothetical protein
LDEIWRYHAEFFYALTLIALIGCGGGFDFPCILGCGDSSDSDVESPTIITRNENNATFTVTEGSLGDIQYELHITGSGNTITIAINQNICCLRFIGGSNNLVTFPPQTSDPGLHIFLDTITSTGSDNTIFLPNASVTPNIVDLGNGDQIIYY